MISLRLRDRLHSKAREMESLNWIMSSKGPLPMLDFSLSFVLQVDASGQAVEMVVSQKVE